MEGVWGQLYPHSGPFPRLALKQEMFRLGGAQTSNYVIRESDMGNRKWLNAVSKCQCEIVRKSTEVFLRDKNSNGIWANSNKVGKDNMWLRFLFNPSLTQYIEINIIEMYTEVSDTLSLSTILYFLCIAEYERKIFKCSRVYIFH